MEPGIAFSKHGKDEKYIEAESKVLLERTIIGVSKIVQGGSNMTGTE